MHFRSLCCFRRLTSQLLSHKGIQPNYVTTYMHLYTHCTAFGRFYPTINDNITMFGCSMICKNLVYDIGWGISNRITDWTSLWFSCQLPSVHDGMEHILQHWPLCREFTGHRWFISTVMSNFKLTVSVNNLEKNSQIVGDLRRPNYICDVTWMK